MIRPCAGIGGMDFRLAREPGQDFLVDFQNVVLVVEDQSDSRELMDAMLVRCGVRVYAVDSVPDALEALDTHPVDVIISDIGLEGEDGLTLMRRVRERPLEKGGSVPAIAVSAYGGPADRARAAEAGYQTYLTKPLNPGEVIAAVAALLRLG